MKQVNICYARDMYEPKGKKGCIPHDEYINKRENRYKQASARFYKKNNH